MKPLSGLLAFVVCMVGSFAVRGQQRCGTDEYRHILEQTVPQFQEKFANRLKETNEKALQSEKLKVSGSSTADVVVPVIFHIIVNEGQFQQMGGKWGIEQRCRTQIDVLNEDFNHANFDSSLVPALWQSLYANVGIHFALAHTDPNGYPSPGYTVRLTSKLGFCCLGGSFDSAKFTNYGGTDAWDVNKYVNIWCIGFNDWSISGLLGITVPMSVAASAGIESGNVGICITYSTLGRRKDTADVFPINLKDSAYFDLGRTVTHEMGHMFEIWHVWGDDNGLCPWDPDGRSVLPDIPPQGNATNINPVYTIPGGTVYDNCKDSSGVMAQPYGIACLDFMDYTDDQGMHLFTNDQAAVMRAMVIDPGGESYSLTQHPEVLEWPHGAPQTMNLFPNPTTGMVQVYYDDVSDQLLGIQVYNVAGEKVSTIVPDATTELKLDLSGLVEGVYLIRFQFSRAVEYQKVAMTGKRN